MSVFVRGTGAVSPAGWGTLALVNGVSAGQPISPKPLVRPGWEQPLLTRQVPPPAQRPAFLAHPRFRRTSPISHFVVAAALEALGQDLPLVQRGDLRLGMIVCVMSGCVNYSRRFYQETRENPATASPLVFPETVFNAPASHVSALLGIQTINYTLVGDPGTFLQGLALAADWITNGKVDGVLVAGAEESDWLIADAYRHFCKGLVVSDGAGALYLSKNSAEPLAELQAVTDSFIYSSRQQRAGAALKMAKQMVNTTPQPVQLFDSCVGISRVDGAELAAWGRFAWPRTSVKKILGEGLMAASAWQCVAAVQHLKERAGTVGVSVVGCNQQAIGCLFSS